MLKIIERFTNEPEWRAKVFDETAVAQWKTVTLARKAFRNISDKAFDFCIAELCDKAGKNVDIDSVAVLDTELAVIKSDDLISEELRQELIEGVKVLENYEEWRPSPSNMVLDLVDPSLYSLMYGRSRVLPNKTISVENCLQHCGKGGIIRAPPYSGSGGNRHWSRKFQWLPSEVGFTDDGVKVLSYINNLHPKTHANLYTVAEKYIAKAVPIWNQVLSNFGLADHGRSLRIYPRSFSGRRPEPMEYSEWMPVNLTSMNLREKFPQGLQVIVQLVNIHLTPENPRYEGGQNRVEGMLNEHICSTLLYDYDCENITASYLEFYQMISHDALEEVIENMCDSKCTSRLYDGRAIGFPNVQQHRITPFKLAGRTKPGHRKILALFLVDPSQRVLSTANVPPQQRDWWAQAVRMERTGKLSQLPAELFNNVMENVDFPSSLTEAKTQREESRTERKGHERSVDSRLTFSAKNSRPPARYFPEAAQESMSFLTEVN
ncbi:hypothetical protein EJ06DRAFT_556315 [Trichodelitschia bisporula]|uniref:Uncharacterized protein n=1 Tax=Trichodelitschia bisporula TaxID=703511 RepID=A0A6G1HYA0_9PEZI|nr:hypothetical protein EJ06DRAFT_556315 [Trichodelitschia bisporula]